MKFNVLNSQVIALEKDIEAEKTRLGETIARIERSDVSFNAARDVYKEKILAGEDRDLKKLEAQLDSISQETRRDKALTEALQNEIPIIEKQLMEARQQRNELFNKLAEGWLRREIKTFDDAAMKINVLKKRLLAAFELLRKSDGGEVYRQTVGEAFSFIPSVKVPILSNFDRATFTRTEGSSSMYVDEVYNEITK